MIRLKRIYDEYEKGDGIRILVERLWPRGFTKERAAVDLWLKEVAPSSELRKWFGHIPERWTEFRRRYLAELKQEPAQAAVAKIREQAKRGAVTLLYAAHDEEHNAAVALLAYLMKHETAKQDHL
jgi:uncharacterized protein YeaO (DUF488 family)